MQMVEEKNLQKHQIQMNEEKKNQENNDKMKEIEKNLHIDIVLFNEWFVGTSYMEVIEDFLQIDITLVWCMTCMRYMKIDDRICLFLLFCFCLSNV